MKEEASAQVVRAWGIPDQHAASAISSQVGAVRWRHEGRDIDNAGVTQDTLVMMLSDASSQLHRGGRCYDAVTHRGGLGLLAAGTEGRWTFERPFECLHFYLPPQFLEKLGEGQGGTGMPLLDMNLRLDDPLLQSLMREVVQVMAEPDEPTMYLDTLGAVIGTRLLRAHSNAKSCATRRGTNGLAPWQQRRAIEMLNANLSDELRLDELARAVHLSPFHFARAFKASTGLPPHAYLMNLRLAEAKRLLLTTDKSITEVALDVGYQSAQALSRLFRRDREASPAKWRRERL